MSNLGKNLCHLFFFLVTRLDASCRLKENHVAVSNLLVKSPIFIVFFALDDAEIILSLYGIKEQKAKL